MNNPFRILIIMAVVVAIAFAAGFVYVVFVKHNIPREKVTLGTYSLVESV